MNDGFVFVDEHVPGIYWDSKYATWDNFTGRPVDGYVANRIVGTKRRHYPNIERTEMFEQGYVATRSGHSRGSTVDLTLYRLDTGQRAPMGGDHDLMDAISRHGAEEIGAEEASNRECLRNVMEASGFASCAHEWWHYTLRDEPYPDTYFDFPIVA